jgi:ATP-binding cassette subfamily E protein 1
MENELATLSGGELQRVAIAACLGRKAGLYLLDEPSAYLDVEQRLGMAKVIRRTMEKREAAAFVVDHDVLAVDYISDRLLVFSGEPGKRGKTHGPLDMRDGMNLFLRDVSVTFRRDPHTGRARANKPLGRRAEGEGRVLLFRVSRVLVVGKWASKKKLHGSKTTPIESRSSYLWESSVRPR